MRDDALLSTAEDVANKTIGMPSALSAYGLVCGPLILAVPFISHELFSKIVVDSFHRSLRPSEGTLLIRTSEHALFRILTRF